MNENPSAIATATATPAAPPTTRPKILVIDDDRDLAQMIGLRLHALGYEASVANDGPSGINLAKKVVPDLIVLDVMMPGMDGFEVCAALKKQLGAACPKIILLSAVTSGLVVDPAAILKQSGADAFIPKPYDAPTVRAKINELLGIN